ncbi:hypothetical protein QN347_19905, partial [Sphingomonas sp. 10B4]|nr:hypothetical protein [Sphingomonas sp. 10B4]
ITNTDVIYVGITADSTGNLYTIARDSSNLNTILKITPTGIASSVSVPSNDSRSYGISVDATGNIIFANQQSGTISKISPAGAATVLAGAA